MEMDNYIRPTILVKSPTNNRNPRRRVKIKKSKNHIDGDISHISITHLMGEGKGNQDRGFPVLAVKNKSDRVEVEKLTKIMKFSCEFLRNFRCLSISSLKYFIKFRDKRLSVNENTLAKNLAKNDKFYVFTVDIGTVTTGNAYVIFMNSLKNEFENNVNNAVAVFQENSKMYKTKRKELCRRKKEIEKQIEFEQRVITERLKNEKSGSGNEIMMFFPAISKVQNDLRINNSSEIEKLKSEIFHVQGKLDLGGLLELN